ncbi:MAG: hypothetical protein IJC94_03800 [Oscillospiraceae bacterium]|nr:hypothetical protein [Oscillospiraceae bacterium]
MKRTVKILSVLLTFVMVFQFFPSAVCAQADDNLANSDYINFNLETREATGYSFDDLTDYTGGLDYACSPGYFPNAPLPMYRVFRMMIQ